MIGPMSQCGTCTRFRSPLHTGADKPSCAAFPDGIPADVLRTVVDHRQQVEGDHGLRWESNGLPFPASSLNAFDLPRMVRAATGDGDANRIQQQWEQARADLLEQWPQAAQPMVDELADQAQTAAEQNDLGSLGELAVSAGVIAALALLLDESASALAVAAASGVAAEAAAVGVVITVPALAGAVRVRQTADAYARIIAAGYAAGAARAALQLAGASPAEIRAAVEQHLTDLGASTGGLVGDNLGALLSAAQHAGRLAVLEAHPAKAYEAVEVNDRNRCTVCAKADGHRYRTLAAALKDYPAAGNKSCLGGLRCRGFLRPIFT